MSTPNENPPQKPWRRYEECRPDELAELVARSPVALWPMGLIEHHGWHLPVGLDALKAQQICLRLAQRTGGVLLPTLWWGWGGPGGHADFLWTHYRQTDASGPIIHDAVEQLISFGFRAIVVLAGHGPFNEILQEQRASLQRRYPQTLLLFGLESTIADVDLGVGFDHAGREETSDALELFPQLVDMSALRPGRPASSQWPRGVTPPTTSAYPNLVLNPASDRFGQCGQDARLASAEHARQWIDPLVNHLAERIQQHLSKPAPGEGEHHVQVNSPA